MATDKLKRVFICSPYRGIGRTEDQRNRSCEGNLRLAKTACLFAVMKGCVPYAPHLYFPRFLMDSDPHEREVGMLLGLTWLAECDELWVIGRSVSEGMEREIRKAREWGIPIRQYIPRRGPEDRLLDMALQLNGGNNELDF